MRIIFTNIIGIFGLILFIIGVVGRLVIVIPTKIIFEAFENKGSEIVNSAMIIKNGK